MTKRQGWANDLRLVQLTLAGDGNAIALFADRMVCIPKFISVFNSRSGAGLTKEDLLDACQETRLRLWRDRPRFNGKCLLETWIYRYAQLVFRELVRDAALTSLESFDTSAESAGCAELETSVDHTPATVDQSMRLKRLRRALGALDLDAQEVITLKVFEGFSFTETAKILGLNVNTTKSRFYHALGALEALLIQRRGKLDTDQPVA